MKCFEWSNQSPEVAEYKYIKMSPQHFGNLHVIRTVCDNQFHQVAE
jgi:hypothetical protein